MKGVRGWTPAALQKLRQVIQMTENQCARPGGADSAYEMGGDARRLAKGCKFRILVSLRVFWAKRHHI